MAKDKHNGLVIGVGLMILMFAVSFISVPLYQIFCQKTGYGGTPRIATAPTGDIADRDIIIDFFATTHRSLMCDFIPLQKSMKIKVGELALAFYEINSKVENSMDAIAAYNVTPDKVGKYFMKVECFCFDDRKISTGAETLPVQYYIHPDFATDPDMMDVKRISLLYTFYPKKAFDISQYLRKMAGNRKALH